MKGKTEPMQFYEVYNSDPLEIQKLKKKSGRFMKQGLYLRQRRRWDEAVQSFQKALNIYPDDAAVQFHLQTCLDLKNNPPPEDWDGAIHFDSK